MKRTSLLLLVATLLLSLGFTTTGDPIAKIYVFGDLLLRSNTASGRIDIFDLRQPATLPQIGSINLAMNNDVAVVGNILYADAGRDLVLFDISNVSDIRAIDTVRGVFNQLYRMSFEEPGMGDDMVVSDGGFSGCGSGCGSDSPTEPVARPNASSDGMESTGKAGSLARFAIAGNYLYCIDYSDVIVFDIAMPERPQLKNRVTINWEIETLFPYENTLFVGGSRGVYLVDINDGEAPRPISQFEHGRGCDPVVVENDIAYVTLRSGTPCGDVPNQLHIIDVSNLFAPRLLKSVDVTNPYGLAVEQGIVYLCDGVGGLKIIDTRDVTNPRTVGTIPGIVPFDAILVDKKLIVTTSDRATVYDISAPATPLAMGSVELRK
jgi:hypothetical protein